MGGHVFLVTHKQVKINVQRHNMVFVPFTMCELNDAMTKLCNDKTCMLRKCKNMMHKCISKMHAGIILCSQGHSSKVKVNHAHFYIWLIEPSKINYHLKLHQKFSSYGQFFVTVKGQGHVSPKSGHFHVSVIFVLIYFLVLVLVFQLFSSFSFVLVLQYFSF